MTRQAVAADAPSFTDTITELFADCPPSPRLRVTVVVPVRNEADHLVQTLDALRGQLDGQGKPLRPDSFEVLMLLNNCTDESYAVAAAYQRQHPTFALHLADVWLAAAQANIGTVRRLLMDAACRRLMSTPAGCGIIASTDGDTVVDRQWLHHIMAEIANGNDAVGGRILTRPDNSSVRLNHLRDVTYRTLVARVEALLDPHPNDPWPRHFQHFGASIAVTCAMYLKAGRLPQLPYLEDEAFYRALLRTDARIRKSPQVRVFTSTRMAGRVEVGFSQQLAYWADMNGAGREQVVEPAEAVVTRIRNRQRLRFCWQAQAFSRAQEHLRLVAEELRLDPHWLAQEVTKHPFFGQLWERVETELTPGRWVAAWPLSPITQAIQELRAYIREFEAATC